MENVDKYLGRGILGDQKHIEEIMPESLYVQVETDQPYKAVDLYHDKAFDT